MPLFRLRRRKKISQPATSSEVRSIVKEELELSATTQKKIDEEEKHKQLVITRISSLKPRARLKLLRYLKGKKEEKHEKK